jgi:hypothetical protein
MARMYPNQLSPDTISDAERRLYEALRDRLEDGYTVFHSVAWQSLDAEGRPRDGEADFVIAHPRRGILVMEAKGRIFTMWSSNSTPLRPAPPPWDPVGGKLKRWFIAIRSTCGRPWGASCAA